MTENFELAKPLGDIVLVEIESKEKTIGGIIIPDSVKTGDNKIAVVVSTGPGVFTHSGTKIPMTVKQGDKVLLPSGDMAVQKIKLGEKDYFLCREMDLLMVIR
jgi:chaperonin GroES